MLQHYVALSSAYISLHDRFARGARVPWWGAARTADQFTQRRRIGSHGRWHDAPTGWQRERE